MTRTEVHARLEAISELLDAEELFSETYNNLALEEVYLVDSLIVGKQIIEGWKN